MSIKDMICKFKKSSIPLEKVWTYLDPQKKEKIYKIAEENGISASEMVRIIIYDFLDNLVIPIE